MKDDDKLTADFVEQYSEEVMDIMRPLSAVQAYSVITNIQLAMETAIKQYFKKGENDTKTN